MMQTKNDTVNNPLIVDGAPPLLVIVGPTAIGKTALSLRLASKLSGEIISADSRLFYKQMDIGTAKPTAEEQGDIPHHFIDICEPDETVTLGSYQRQAFAKIDAIHTQGNLPIMVGGTGQYVQAVVEGWGIPEVAPQPALRAQLALEDKASLYSRLQALDPIAAAKIHPNNVRRIVRALEVCIVTETPISTLQKKTPPPYAILIIGLRCERQILYERIDARVDLMMEAGLLAEVQALQACGFTKAVPSMSGLGYAQLFDHLNGELTLAEAVERIKFETHRFVRHQNNWFQPDDPRINWFDVLSDGYPADAIAQVEAWLGLAG